MPEPVLRIVRRRARPGCERAYVELIRGMFDDASRFPGYRSAELIPPEQPGGDYQVVQRFATAADLERWDASPQRALWLERLQPVAGGDPEYRLLSGLDAWFAPTPVAAAHPPKRWRMTVVSWLGIFPTVGLLLHFVAPLLAPLPFLLRTALFTALVAVLMAYVVMPRLTRWMAGWLRR
ncbi:MAG TPA: antibiotic biosynthesis monooxygenase [Methylibium sp.]|nr:antibiotic biosynthesis monooxygenase [Methylibium sp.]